MPQFIPRSPRKPTLLKGVYDDGETFVSGPIKNLSATGLFLETKTPLSPGTRLRVVPLLPETDGVEIQAEVARVAHEEGGAKPGIGLRFVGLGHEQREQLRALCLREARVARQGVPRGIENVAPADGSAASDSSLPVLLLTADDAELLIARQAEARARPGLMLVDRIELDGVKAAARSAEARVEALARAVAELEIENERLVEEARAAREEAQRLAAAVEAARQDHERLLAEASRAWLVEGELDQLKEELAWAERERARAEEALAWAKQRGAELEQREAELRRGAVGAGAARDEAARAALKHVVEESRSRASLVDARVAAVEERIQLSEEERRALRRFTLARPLLLVNTLLLSGLVVGIATVLADLPDALLVERAAAMPAERRPLARASSGGSALARETSSIPEVISDERLSVAADDGAARATLRAALENGSKGAVRVAFERARAFTGERPSGDLVELNGPLERGPIRWRAAGVRAAADEGALAAFRGVAGFDQSGLRGAKDGGLVGALRPGERRERALSFDLPFEGGFVAVVFEVGLVHEDGRVERRETVHVAPRG